MRLPTIVLVLTLTVALCASLFHIGQLNLRNNHVHEELNICAAELDALLPVKAQLATCENDLLNAREVVRKAIEKSVEYCRG